MHTAELLLQLGYFSVARSQWPVLFLQFFHQSSQFGNIWVRYTNFGGQTQLNAFLHFFVLWLGPLALIVAYFIYLHGLVTMGSRRWRPCACHHRRTRFIETSVRQKAETEMFRPACFGCSVFMYRCLGLNTLYRPKTHFVSRKTLSVKTRCIGRNTLSAERALTSMLPFAVGANRRDGR